MYGIEISIESKTPILMLTVNNIQRMQVTMYHYRAAKQQDNSQKKTVNPK